jgi:3-deoxy-manno-octulosonate cytidylyltransferase (CMP-KDO synthetase)
MRMSKVAGIIPARWGSTRFPGKSLARIAGKPMIQRVVERVLQAERLSTVAVATDDQRIAAAVSSWALPRVQVCMTRADHPSGTDRIAEAVQQMEAGAVINIQGDEPLIDPALIDTLAEAIGSGPWDMVTAAAPLEDPAQLTDPAVVKAVFNACGEALYFSRAAVPHVRDGLAPGAPPVHWRHIGIYAYRREYLMRLVAQPPCRLEQLEKLEQLRALDMGCRMKVVQTQAFGAGVDTPEDVAAVEQLLRRAGLE